MKDEWGSDTIFKYLYFVITTLNTVISLTLFKKNGDSWNIRWIWMVWQHILVQLLKFEWETSVPFACVYNIPLCTKETRLKFGITIAYTETEQIEVLLIKTFCIYFIRSHSKSFINRFQVIHTYMLRKTIWRTKKKRISSLHKCS